MKAVQVAGGNIQKPGGNWSIFDFCNQFLQTAEELREATCDLLTRLRRDHNVLLVEVRFCPTLHTLEGLSPREALEAVISGITQAKRRDVAVEAGVIVCALRSRSEQEAVDLADLCQPYLGKGVVGYDVAGDEGSFPLLPKMRRGIVRAKELHIPVTLHAGEWPVNDKFGTQSIENLEQATDQTSPICADRIGHACQLLHSPNNAILSSIMASRIPVECCLTSNCAWKIPSYKEHPIFQMLVTSDPPVVCCLNCDNTLLSGSAEEEANPTGELIHLVDDVLRGNGLNEEQVKATLKRALLNGVDSSFIFKVEGEEGRARKEGFRANFEKTIDQVIN
ncbi:hypothetical protein TrVE_jg66 [Triparma verrucosa]|uniref:adenosine deaminase n=1 Tax=Triparma verrucosa TaxID=1606542 RepID=A0A9W7C020_9STRA|nr:hypothetical protein TrVE_jg66 [Triparma verrucosa]